MNREQFWREREQREPIAEELRVEGYAINLIALLAEDPANGLHEIAPGIFSTQRDGWGSSA